MCGERLNESIYKQNQDVLAARHPQVLSRLADPSPIGFQILQTYSGDPNLLIEREDNSAFALYPSDNPLKSFFGPTAGLSEIRGKIICLFGLGLGYHAREVLRQAGGCNIVVIYEAIPAMLEFAMAHVDLVDVFAHPHVRLVVGQPVDLAALFHRERDILFAGRGYSVAEIGPLVQLAPDWYAGEKQRMQRFVQGLVIANQGMAKNGRRHMENRFRNLYAMARAIPLGTLENCFQGKPAIIVASGPSLSKNIQHLKKAKGKSLIIAADSAVGPLLSHEIVPDIVVSVDINDFTFEKLGPFVDRLKGTGLLFIPEVTPKIPNYIDWKFKIFTLLSPYTADLFNQLLKTREKPLLYAQSVVHLALGAAQRMGCDPIVFTGLDLAYDREKDHAEGAVLHWGNRQQGDGENDVLVEGINGEMIPTNVGLLNMLETCQALIRQAPERRYVDATEGGARISGTQTARLSEAIARDCSTDFGSRAVFHSSAAGPSLPDVTGNLRCLKEDGEDLLTRIDAFRGAAGMAPDFFGNQDDVQHFLQWVSAHLTAEDRRRLNALHTALCAHPLITALADLLASDTGRYTGFEIAIAEAEAAGAEADIRNARLGRECFLLAIRRQALMCFVEMIEKQWALFRRVEQGDAARTTEEKTDIARCFLENGLVAAVFGALEGLPHKLAEKQFLVGAVHILRGDVKEGVCIFESIISELNGSGADIGAFLAGVEAAWLDECDRAPLFPFRKIVLDRVLSIAETTDENLERISKLLIAVTKFLFAREEEDAAIMLLEKAIKGRFRGNALLTARLARFLVEAGRFDEGIQRLEAATRIDPDTAVLWEEIGDALASQQDVQTALVAYEKCSHALPSRWEVLRKIGDCYAAMGKPAAARLAYAAALEKRPM